MRRGQLGVFGNSVAAAIRQGFADPAEPGQKRRGIAGWLIERLQRRAKAEPRLAVVERVTLAPRQFLALVEADGQQLLVATAPDGPPAFYALNPPTSARPGSRARKSLVKRTAA